jgi:hypothetical protein
MGKNCRRCRNRPDEPPTARRLRVAAALKSFEKSPRTRMA